MPQKCTTSEDKSAPLDHLGHIYHGFVIALLVRASTKQDESLNCSAITETFLLRLSY